jgi:hypothetical protein
MANYDDAILRQARMQAASAKNTASKIANDLSAFGGAGPNIAGAAAEAGVSLDAFGGKGEPSPGDVFIPGIGWGTTPSQIAESVEGAISSVEGAIAGKIDAATVTKNLSSSIQGALASVTNFTAPSFGGSSFQPNPLEEFASFNNIFTLGVLSADEVNFPETTYRTNGPKIKILRSGGGLGSSKATTAYESRGRVEYFIDNVSIDSIIAPKPSIGSSNATSISFEVTEPYSMGLFLQSLMTAALSAGHANYIEATYVLQIDFVGHDDFGNIKIIENTTRYYPLRFVDIKFNVTAGGSVYTVEAIPWNEVAFADDIQKVKGDVSPTGRTVAEILQTGENSLTSILNRREKEKQKANEVSTPDEYVIIFPKSDTNLSQVISTPAGSATTTKEDAAESIGAVGVDGPIIDKIEEMQKTKGTSIGKDSVSTRLSSLANSSANDIGTSKTVGAPTERGKSPMGVDAFIYDEVTGLMDQNKLTISSDIRQYNFSQKTEISKIIEAVVLTSEWAKSIVDKQPDGNGMLPWFRIETKVFINQDYSDSSKSGKTPAVYVYSVVPYLVHHSVFKKSSSGSVGYPSLKSNAVKEYNYIYTGKNKDIINFDINFNFAFFTALQDDRGQGAPNLRSNGQDGALATEQTVLNQAEGAGEFNPDGEAPKVNTIEPKTAPIKGTELDDQKIRVARQFHDAVINSDVDLVQLQLEILGDPYYISDSGMGNYNSPPSGALNITSDGSMNYQNGEVDVIVNFRTPIDYREDTGGMLFPDDGTRLTPFSGLYRVIMVKNTWSGNQFTQTLDMIRRPNQEKEGTASDAFAFFEGGNPIGDFQDNLDGALQGVLGKAQGLLNGFSFGSALSDFAPGVSDALKQVEGASAQIQNTVNQATGSINNITQSAAEIENRITDLRKGITRGF